MGDNVTLSITILLTGFAVVFSVLLILIGIIKGYGTVVYSIQTKQQKKKASRNVDLPKVVREPEEEAPTVDEEIAVEDNDELIAVISAAVYTMYSSSDVRIKSIRKAPVRSNAWRNAGISDNVRPF